MLSAEIVRRKENMFLARLMEYLQPEHLRDIIGKSITCNQTKGKVEGVEGHLILVKFDTLSPNIGTRFLVED